MYEAIYKNVLGPVYEKRIKKRKTIEYLNKLEKSQWYSSEKLLELQYESLTRLITHVYENTPYWSRVFNGLNIKPEDIKGIEDIQKLPVMDKDTIRDHYDEMIAEDHKGKTWHKSTGGSTGQPLHFEYTPMSYDWRVASSKRGYSWAGCEDGIKQAYIWGIAIGKIPILKNIKEKLHHAILRQRYYNCFDFDKDRMDETLDNLNRYRPEYIIGYTNPLYEFTRYIEESGNLKFRPTSVITAAEKLHEFQREKISNVFNAPVFNTYGSREFMLIASECEKHKGLHVSMENLIVEILREDGTPAECGETGDIVITDLHNYGMPFIRYKIGDLGIMSERKCECGRGLMLLEEVIGRSLDVIRTPDGKVVPGEYFPHMMKEFEEVRKFQVVQHKLDEISVKIKADPSLLPEREKYMDSLIKSVLGDECRVKYEYVEDIKLTKTGKHRVTVSEI